jgi:formylglycine-generating enzyme required for sulfatase activity
MHLSQAEWRKATRSNSNGGDCVEAASLPTRTEWRKAARSNSNGGACVEAASLPSVVAVRDSKDPDGPKLAFAPASWRAFTGRIRAGHGTLV